MIWLPVKQQITYKIAAMAYSCVRGTCRAYFSDVCVPVQAISDHAKLRSARHGHLIVSATKMKAFGSRRLHSAALTVWNSSPFNLLDINIGSGLFTSGLETWLSGLPTRFDATKSIIDAAP